MPRLLAFLPCDKILVDDKGNASLIVLLMNVGVQVGKEGIPKNAVAPREWDVFTLWQQSAQEDVEKTFHQVLQLVLPDGTEFMKSGVEFKMQQGKLHQNRITVQGMPVGQAGKLIVNMWLEEQSAKWTEVYSYPLTVSHNHTSS